MTMDKNYLKKISQILCEFIYYTVDTEDDYSSSLFIDENILHEKIDILERALEILRVEKRYIENNLSMEEFIQGQIAFDGARIKYVTAGGIKSVGSGTKPIALQPKLLLYLLYRHNRSYENVYNIIDNFIKLIWDNLNIIDFKKTKTGVFRCFTNTRFAAHTLRDYGLLLYTNKEAYKTWSLSLPGILVASKIMEVPNWEVPPVIQNEYHFDLHPDIRNAFEELKTYDKYVQRLISVCNPDTKLFKDFKEGSKRSYSLMSDYWLNLRDSSISAKERKKKSMAKLKQINQDQEIKIFFKEFCLCFKIGDFINTK